MLGEKGLVNKYNVINLFLKTYNYNRWFESEESYDTTSRKSHKEELTDIPPLPSLDGDEEEV